MKKIFALILFAVLVGSAFAQTDTATIQRAANAVPSLRSMMKDPDSFVLENVFTTSTPVIVCETKWCRHKEHVLVPSVCFAFRAHNSYGGYGDGGMAVLTEAGRLSVLEPRDGKNDYYDSAAKISLTKVSEPNQPCQTKFIAADITADTKTALAPTAPATTPEDKAKKAQQYADCLKMAVDNPSIVCKAPQESKPQESK